MENEIKIKLNGSLKEVPHDDDSLIPKRELTLQKFNVFCGQNIHGFNELIQELKKQENCFVMSGIFVSLDGFIKKFEKRRVNAYLHSGRNRDVLRVVVIKHFMENVSRHDFYKILDYLQKKFPELTFVVWTQNEHAIQACAECYRKDMHLFRFDYAENPITEYVNWESISFAIKNDIWLS